MGSKSNTIGYVRAVSQCWGVCAILFNYAEKNKDVNFNAALVAVVAERPGMSLINYISTCMYW